MSSATAAITEGEILSHAVETIDEAQRPEVCRTMSQLRLPDRDLDRVDDLLTRNRAGMITEAERAELENFLRVGNFLALVRARALRELRQKAEV